jgi:hypothetical protein
MSGQTISSSTAMAPSTAKGSSALFLSGMGGYLGRSMPQLEDDASATDLCKEMDEEEKNISE